MANLIWANDQLMTLKENKWKTFFYVYEVWSLMYAQICTRPDIALVVENVGDVKNPRELN